MRGSPDLQEPFNDARRTLPLRFFLVELLAPGAGQGVDPHATAALGGAPFGRNPPHLLQLEQRRIQRALVECELIPADLFDSPRDPIPVQRAQGLQGLDDHQAEGAVEDVALVGRHVLEAYTSHVLTVNWSDVGCEASGPPMSASRQALRWAQHKYFGRLWGGRRYLQTAASAA